MSTQVLLYQPNMYTSYRNGDLGTRVVDAIPCESFYDYDSGGVTFRLDCTLKIEIEHPTDYLHPMQAHMSSNGTRWYAPGDVKPPAEVLA